MKNGKARTPTQRVRLLCILLSSPRACPGFADTEGVGVTQYPPMYKHGGEMPGIQQADVGKAV